MTAPYYADEHVTLYLGDFREHMPHLVGADAIVTDPPYGETALDWDRWPLGWLGTATAISSNLWCFGSMRMFLDRRDEFHDWKFAQDIVWEKHNGSGFLTDRFRRVHEHATQWYRGDWAALHHETPKTADAVKKTVRRKEKPQHMGAIKGVRFASVDGGDRLMRSVIRLRSMHGRAINPTEKPVQLVSLLVASSVPLGGLVVDPFAGSGSTGVAARQLGRRAILCEMREEQAELTARRLERETAIPFDVEMPEAPLGVPTVPDALWGALGGAHVSPTPRPPLRRLSEIVPLFDEEAADA